MPQIDAIRGMNVKIPGEGSIHAFWVIMGVMLAVLVSMLLFFRKRGWL
jgi:magnesium transporter